MLYILGYIDTMNASEAHPQWRAYVKQFCGEITVDSNTKSALSNSGKALKESSKRQNAKAYISHLCDIYFGETIASLDGATTNGTVKDVKILPYETVNQLYAVRIIVYIYSRHHIL